MHAELLAVTFGGFWADIGRSLREAFYMFWDTLWALVLGFGLSGAVQAFVSRDAMQRRLGDHKPASIARVSLYGMASSSCSYARRPWPDPSSPAARISWRRWCSCLPPRT